MYLSSRMNSLLSREPRFLTTWIAWGGGVKEGVIATTYPRQNSKGASNKSLFSMRDSDFFFPKPAFLGKETAASCIPFLTPEIPSEDHPAHQDKTCDISKTSTCTIPQSWR